MDNNMGIDCGSGACDGWMRAKGQNSDNCDKITIKMIKYKMQKS